MAEIVSMSEVKRRYWFNMILIINGYGIFNIERYGLFIAYFKTLSDIHLKRHLQ
jgi:hypothetical protein